MFEMVLSSQTEQPLYLQIYKQIRSQISGGALAAGIRLPSVRALQLQLNISKTPIETAYQMLLSEGYVVSKPRSGLFVVHLNTCESLATATDLSQSTSLRVVTSPDNTKPRELIDFYPASVDESAFPYRTWKRMLNDVLDRSVGLNRCGDEQGEYGLRKVIAEYLRSSRGVVCEPEQIVIGSGMSYSINILSKLLKDIPYIAMEDPGYENVREQLVHNEFKVLPIPTTEQGISIAHLEQSEAECVYVTPSHQYPLGTVMPYAQREQLLQWAQARDAYIIEDDYDGEFRYLGKPIPSLQGLDRGGRVIYIGTFSKSFTPALRMNYMVLPIVLMERMKQLQYLLFNPSRIDQWAMQSFFEQGHWYRHIRRMRNLYRKKHEYLIQLVTTHLSEIVEITNYSAGLNLLLTLRSNLPLSTLIERADEVGVRVYGFEQSWMNGAPHGAPQLHLGFGKLSDTELERGILLLKKAWFV
ncbi:PLP-dependent aminotransferase family protein [Paenibacillus sp. N1-5-1-14]|uniref:MocR-like pyridoxine biosynthesis transcription factor PdxR n=1 Tax=Paenibacillus radicibacter TaxID=2972488 RepID=UPI002159099E|nr:PLP-dependent aminotransferase family protein [Paenibacillus radicibacter]MCR8642869.1 PLP-dependent aminotransferase family protein [Paenibacillus radicibacter]